MSLRNSSDCTFLSLRIDSNPTFLRIRKIVRDAGQGVGVAADKPVNARVASGMEYRAGFAGLRP